MAIFLMLLGCSLFCMGIGLWAGYFLGRTSALEWLKDLTGVRIDRHGRVVRPEYVDVAADGRILKFGEVAVEPGEEELVKVDGKWKLTPSRRDSRPHG